MVYNMFMNLNTRKGKEDFQRKFLKQAGVNFEAVKAMMDTLPHVGFYIKDCQDRIITLNRRNFEISALKDEFDAIGKTPSELFPGPIGDACLERDRKVRRTDHATLNGTNYATVDRDPTPTVYSVFPLHDSNGNVIGTMCGFYTGQSTGTPPSNKDRLKPALALMIANSGLSTSLKQLAAASHMSISTFRRLFLQEFKETPAKYALRLRLNRARVRLENTDETVASIAADTGFYDQSHFIKAFHRVYKITPDTYRQRHRNKQNRSKSAE